MKFSRLVQVVAIIVFCYGLRPVCAQEKPVEVSGCELAQNPKKFDQEWIRVRGTLNVHFEDFSLGVGKCQTRQGIWLAFGGDVPGIVVSMANDNSREPGSDIRIDGVSYGIKKDDSFHKLYALIAARHGDRPDYAVTATLTGKFLAGEEMRSTKDEVTFAGYGHLGCCSLFLITQVSDVESVPPANLTLYGTVIGANGKPAEGLTVINDVLGGSPPERQKTTTNEHGEFSFANSGQQLRIEDPRFRPVALTVEPGRALVRVTLQDAKSSDWVVSACRDSESIGKVGFSVRFTLPLQMQSSPMEYDDRKSTFVYAKGEDAAAAELFLSHKLDGTIEEADSLDSKQFEQRWVKDEKGNVLGIDSRGVKSDSEPWREATFFGNESAEYWLRSHSGKRKEFDAILDSACLAHTH